MSSQKKLLTVFGATGNQGGSVIDIILANESLQQKYSLRGITRSVSSRSAATLSQKGVEMVSADLNDLESLKIAVRGSYGVFGVTNFWDPSVLSKEIEMRQGRNIFEAVRAEGVTHYVFSSLPHAEILTEGKLTHIDHFDGKASVAEYVEEHKAKMIVSFFMPAMYMKSYKDQIRRVEGTPTMIMPFRVQDFDKPVWPVIDPRADSGKYIAGLFEAGSAANGVRVHAVSAWTSPRGMLQNIGDKAGQKIEFKAISREELEGALPPGLAEEISETLLLVGEYAYYGPGQEGRQAENDQWLLKDAPKMTLVEVIAAGGPYEFS